MVEADVNHLFNIVEKLSTSYNLRDTGHSKKNRLRKEKLCRHCNMGSFNFQQKLPL